LKNKVRSHAGFTKRWDEKWGVFVELPKGNQVWDGKSVGPERKNKPSKVALESVGKGDGHKRVRGLKASKAAPRAEDGLPKSVGET